MKKKIESFLINYQTELLKYCTKIAGCKSIGSEYLSQLNLIMLESNKFDSNYITELDIDKRLKVYSFGIIKNLHRNSILKNEKNAKLIDNISSINDNYSVDLEFEYNLTHYENELIYEGYNNDQILKLVRIKSFYRKLNPSQKSLFDNYFTNDLSLRDISKKYKIPLRSVHYQLTILKNKLLKASKNKQDILY